MKKIVFGIPSYKRAEKQSTLDLLKRFGIGKDAIIIATQTRQDYESYAEKYSTDATIIYTEGTCVADNRNTILKWCKENEVERLVMMDDDIKRINILDTEGKRNVSISQGEELMRILDKCFTLANRNNAVIWGAGKCDYALWKSNTIDTKKLLLGCMVGISNFSWQYDRRYKTKEDFEICCRMFANGMNVLRFNAISLDVEHKTKGGCEQWWNDGSNYDSAIRLCDQYPTMVKLKKNDIQEVVEIIKNKKICHIMEARDGQQR